MAAVIERGAGTWAGRAQQVELLEEDRAQVVELGTGRARTVDRATLPRGVREGDVVVDGRLDPELRARLEREVAETRARLAVPAPPGLDLEAEPAPPLTMRRER